VSGHRGVVRVAADHDHFVRKQRVAVELDFVPITSGVVAPAQFSTRLIQSQEHAPAWSKEDRVAYCGWRRKQAPLRVVGPEDLASCASGR
jgi:hypothetical protein